MEKTKQMGRSSSSFTTDLFGPKESLTSPPLLGSIFAPQATVSGKDISTSTPSLGCGNAKHSTTDSITSKGNNLKKDMNCCYEKYSTAEPCYYNSSIYYGARELYPSTNDPNAIPPQVIKKDGGAANPNESNSNCASRGNWWKGSLYY